MQITFAEAEFASKKKQTRRDRLLADLESLVPFFAAVNYQLATQGLYLKEGTVVDATIISAPPSIKNESKSRDPDMRHAKKGNGNAE